MADQSYGRSRFGWVSTTSLTKAEIYRGEAIIKDVHNAATDDHGTKMGFPGSRFGCGRAYYVSSDNKIKPMADHMFAELTTIAEGEWRRELGMPTNDSRDRGKSRSPFISRAKETEAEATAVTTIDSREAARKYGGQFI